MPYEADIAAGDIMRHAQERFRERRDELAAVLDVDLSWRLNAVSDGQRRRVQIMLGCLPPFELLLADEVTVDLDLLARHNFIQYLMKESMGERRATIVYATHIFDGLDGWPTHLVYMSLGRVVRVETYERTPGAPSLYERAMAHLVACRPAEDAARAQAVAAAKAKAEANGHALNGNGEFGGAQGLRAGRLNTAADATMMFAPNRHRR